jgi:hypothetical protein
VSLPIAVEAYALAIVPTPIAVERLPLAIVILPIATEKDPVAETPLLLSSICALVLNNTVNAIIVNIFFIVFNFKTKVVN